MQDHYKIFGRFFKITPYFLHRTKIDINSKILRCLFFDPIFCRHIALLSERRIMSIPNAPNTGELKKDFDTILTKSVGCGMRIPLTLSVADKNLRQDILKPFQYRQTVL